MTAQERYEQFRATLPPRPKRWAEIGLTERPITREPVPNGKPIRKGGWHRDHTTLKKTN